VSGSPRSSTSISGPVRGALNISGGATSEPPTADQADELSSSADEDWRSRQHWTRRTMRTMKAIPRQQSPTTRAIETANERPKRWNDIGGLPTREPTKGQKVGSEFEMESLVSENLIAGIFVQSFAHG
jgi:hypothetical protein